MISRAFTSRARRFSRWRTVLHHYCPGVAAAFVVALLARLSAGAIHAPAVVVALIAGMAFARIAEKPLFKAGMGFSASPLLRIGVALLGAKVILADILSLGPIVAALVVLGVAFALGSGWAVARWFKLPPELAYISATAVAVCGASAALAAASVLPKNAANEKHTTIAIIGASILSTLAMIIYPPLATAAGLSETGAGIFLGASIHDVAQVVGAGYSLSPEAAKTAVLVKLFRVACLAPVVLITAVLYRQNRDRNDLIQAPPLPAFLIAFIALMCASSFGLIKPEQALFLGDVSQWLLLAAVVAIGAKTPFSSLRSMGLRAFSVMLMQTLLLAAFTFGFLYFSHIGWR